MKNQSKTKRQKNTISEQVKALLRQSTARGRGLSALKEIIRTGTARTGSSGYSKGWAHKSIWTSETIAACREIGIAVVNGNDAPRGGASGEYVMLSADRRSNRLLHKYHELIARGASISAVRNSNIESEYRNAIEREFNIVKPFIADYVHEIIESNLLTGLDKSKAQAAILKSMLATAGVEQLTYFWQVWRLITAYIKEKKIIRSTVMPDSRPPFNEWMAKMMEVRSGIESLQSPIIRERAMQRWNDRNKRYWFGN